MIIAFLRHITELYTADKKLKRYIKAAMAEEIQLAREKDGGERS